MGYDHPVSVFDNILEYTSYEWMKEHAEKFSVQHLTKTPVLEKGGMVRKASIGEGKQALSADSLKAFDTKLDMELSAEQKEWLLRGGPLP